MGALGGPSLGTWVESYHIETRLSLTGHAEFGSSRSNCMNVGRVPKIWMTLRPRPFAWGVADPQKHATPARVSTPHFVTVSQTIWGVFRGPKKFGDAGAPPPRGGGVDDPIETHASPSPVLPCR